MLNASAGWAGGRWEIDGFARFQSASYGFAATDPIGLTPVRIGAYAALDGRVAYRVAPGLTLVLVGQDVVAGRQKQTALGLAERRVYLGLTAQF